MEPKSILEFGCESLENNGNEAIKIIYEHFIDQQRHLNAIVHGEFGFPVNKVVLITRDVRDEMISRLLYFAKPMRNQGLPKDSPAEKWAQWIELLEEKERRPRDISSGSCAIVSRRYSTWMSGQTLRACRRVSGTRAFGTRASPRRKSSLPMRTWWRVE